MMERYETVMFMGEEYEVLLVDNSNTKAVKKLAEMKKKLDGKFDNKNFCEVIDEKHAVRSFPGRGWDYVNAVHLKTAEEKISYLNSVLDAILEDLEYQYNSLCWDCEPWDYAEEKAEVLEKKNYYEMLKGMLN